MAFEFQEHEDMIPAPAADANVRVIFKTSDGILFCYGTAAYTVLEAEDAGTYAPGCIYIKAVNAGDSLLYVNQGLQNAIANFDLVTIA